MQTPSTGSGTADTKLWPLDLTNEQNLLLQTTWDAFSDEEAWPVFDHLNAMSETRGFDAIRSLESLPPVLPPHYGLIWYSSHGPPQPETEIVLTIAGMSMVDGAEWLITQYFQLLNSVAKHWRSLPSRPNEPRKLLLTYRDLISELGPSPVPSRLVGAMQKTLVHEPPTWSGTSGSSDPDNWQWNVASSISRFAGTSSMNEYLQRIQALLGPSVPQTPIVQRAGAGDAMESSTADDALTARIRTAWSVKDWDQVARQALVFLEDRLRQLAPGSGSGSTKVVTDVLHPETGRFPLAKNHPGESEGWHLMVLGLFKAIRNAVGHRLDTIQTEEEAHGVVGLVRLILGRIEAEYPTERAD